MSDDTTTREAVERVRAIARDFMAESDALRGEAVLTVLAALDRVTRALDAATTAERDRIRNAVLGMAKSGHAASCSSWLPGQNFGTYPLCDCWVGHVNAALADVARIIDAEA